MITYSYNKSFLFNKLKLPNRLKCFCDCGIPFRLKMENDLILL